MAPSEDCYVFSDGWIYFRAVSGDGYAVCRMREDLSGLEKLADSGGYYLSVAGDALYFIVSGQIRRVGVDGKGLKTLAPVGDWDNTLISTGDYVYVRSGDKILRYRADPWKKVGSIPVRKTDTAFEIADGWIYLAGSDDTARSSRTFYRVRTDGSDRGKWFEAPNYGSLTMWTIWGGKMYYGLEDSARGTAQLRRVNLDGTQDELVLEDLWARWIRGGWAYGTRFVSRPEITTWGDEQSRMYDTQGAYRVNLETGESQYLGGHDIFSMRPAGEIIVLEEDDAWSDAPPAVIRADGTELGFAPRLTA